MATLRRVSFTVWPVVVTDCYGEAMETFSEKSLLFFPRRTERKNVDKTTHVAESRPSLCLPEIFINPKETL